MSSFKQRLTHAPDKGLPRQAALRARRGDEINRSILEYFNSRLGRNFSYAVPDCNPIYGWCGDIKTACSGIHTPCFEQRLHLQDKV